MNSEGSFIGLAPQIEKGTPNVADGDYTYLLLLRSGLSPQNLTLPLDQEVGGGAFLRSVVKAGVTGGGAIQFIPRPQSIGHFLMAYFGDVDQEAVGTAEKHIFSFGEGEFWAPYYTLRSAPGGMVGEVFPDSRLATLSFEFMARDFVRANAAWLGGLDDNISTANWDPDEKIDTGPQFLTALSHIEVPDGTLMKVLRGSVAFQSVIPLDEQWIVGSYTPDDFGITARAVVLDLTVKIDDDGDFYKKVMYDPNNASESLAEWTATVLREGDIDISLVSDEIAGEDGVEDVPHQINIRANGESGQEGNVAFAAEPIDIIPGRQLTLNLSGTFLADSGPEPSPVEVDLINDYSAGYATPTSP